jgi:hypothetical protein
MMKRSQFKGKYKPRNPTKYKGDPNKIFYRSSWERLFMVYCDKSDNIISWSSEETKIPYIFEGKRRSYYPDFQIYMRNHEGVYQEKMIEIKPHSQRNWKINKTKWAAARKVCEDASVEFVVLTEKELF